MALALPALPTQVGAIVRARWWVLISILAAFSFEPALGVFWLLCLILFYIGINFQGDVYRH